MVLILEVIGGLHSEASFAHHLTKVHPDEAQLCDWVKLLDQATPPQPALELLKLPDGGIERRCVAGMRDGYSRSMTVYVGGHDANKSERFLDFLAGWSHRKGTAL
jgi:hypothetical protein